MSADMEFRFRVGAKFCSVAAMVLLVFVSLCPANWLLFRTGYWQIEHFLAFLQSRRLSASLGPGLSWSGEPRG
jgi:hypothetical protein